VRHVPIEGILLTDAELDHSLGLVLLREARRLPLYTTAAAYAVLDRDSRLLPVTRAFSDVPWTELPLDRAVELERRDGASSGLSVEAFAVPAGPPMFAETAAAGHTVGLLVREGASGPSCAFVPACGEVTPDVLARLRSADAVLFDGTFWTDDEIVRLGIGSRTAREMDHLPIAGPGGSLERLAALRQAHRIYTHINNTNPILLEASPERAAVVSTGCVVGYDGLRLAL
jgi:pyrroloquinoline quinone biosynthesis protein B